MSARAAMIFAAAVVMPVQAIAQMSDDDDPQRIERLENQIRQLTGQNEELQYRNRQLEEQIRQLQAGQPPLQPQVPGAQARSQPAPVPPAIAANPPLQQPQYLPPQQTSPPPVVAEQPVLQRGGRRGDAFDPAQNPNAPGAPRALGGGQLPIDPSAPVGAQVGAQIGAPGGRGAGEPLDLANTSPRDAAAPAGGTGLTTLPPTATPRDEFDLGIGYIQRKDYALAEETMRNFVQKYPSDRLVADAQYWLGESMFQRQRYRDAAEAFLNVTTKFETSAKAPDALLRLGQSLAALKEKEAACAAFGEVARKYPRASAGVRQGVDREQKRVKC
jgi:tol-pal system protein YbgF